MKPQLRNQLPEATKNASSFSKLRKTQCSHLVGLDVLFLTESKYVLPVCLLATNAVTRLRGCASSSERSLFKHATYELAHLISQY